MNRIVLLIFLFFSVSLFAQQECAFELEEAQEMYNAGLIVTIPAKLGDCLQHGFTKEEQLQAYKLVIFSYLFNDDYEKADSVMLDFLSDFPVYEPVATDPREFIAMMETYDTRPVMKIGGNISGSLSLPIVAEQFGVHHTTNASGKYNPDGLSIGAGLRIEKQVGENILLTGELSYANIKYSVVLNEEVEEGVVNMEFTDFTTVNYYENQNYLSLPLGLAYSFLDGDFKPFVRAKCIPSLLFSASADGIRDYIVDNTGSINLKPVEVANVNLNSIRRTFNVWMGVGVGFQYRAGPGDLFLEAMYHYNLMPQMPKGVSPYLEGLYDELMFVGDQFHLNQLQFNVGYMFPIYHPKKKGE